MIAVILCLISSRLNLISSMFGIDDIRYLRRHDSDDFFNNHRTEPDESEVIRLIKMQPSTKKVILRKEDK